MSGGSGGGPSSEEEDKDKKKNIEDQDWYHGFRPRKDAIRLVTEPGHFLVRASDTGPTTDIVITACDDNKKPANITLRFENGKYYIGMKNPTAKIPRKFNSVVELVEYYKNRRLSKTLQLKTVVSRPDRVIKRNNVIYEEKDKLGSGNFCSVYKGKLKKSGNDVLEAVAIKISHVAATSPDAETEEAKEARKAMMQEAQLMSYYTHENVIQFYGAVCDHHPVLIVMEFCAGGDLRSHLINHGKETDAREKLIYLYEAARGMFYLHGKKCVHRDLAARNCLISNQGRIKIADFGLSKLMDDDKEVDLEDHARAQVPVRWMAPETLRKSPVFSVSSDVWAFGVIVYEVFSNGVKPWPDDPVKYVATQIRKGNMPALPDWAPHKIHTMTAQMWQADPLKRPGMRVIARDLHVLVTEAGGTKQAERMTLNKVPGVVRTVYFGHEDGSEYECESDDELLQDKFIADDDSVYKRLASKASTRVRGPTPRRRSKSQKKTPAAAPSSPAPS